jgi:hypothetical protein
MDYEKSINLIIPMIKNLNLADLKLNLSLIYIEIGEYDLAYEFIIKAKNKIIEYHNNDET